ncbi:MFS transporter [Bradyrhizobium sp. WYCCWR 13022]|uniref:MFS transporter n=1 Tax=unclassified Bradyrhizobium TaxID=2631580 RepID=UPI00263B23C5|nr:MFS transporter [Bradyrhizobium sp. WYCCWR 13022]MDN4984305.1 MFS transporter [Bradyrhizobium sp. WYCCWR 13022]
MHEPLPSKPNKQSNDIYEMGALAGASAITALHFNMIVVALPNIASDLVVPPDVLQWVVTAFSLAYSGFLLAGGRAADVIGRRKVFLAALLVFALGSALGALANRTSVLLIGRVIQGLGGALLFPSTLSLLNNLFPEGPARHRAFGIWSLVSSSGATFGALAGGALVHALGWRSVFIINLPMVALTALCAILSLPADQPRAGRVSWCGACAAAGTVTAFMTLLAQAGKWGVLSPSSGAVLCLGLISAGLSFRIEKKSSYPLVDRAVFGEGTVSMAMVLAALFMGTFMMLPYFLTLLFQQTYEYDPVKAGLAFLVPSLSIMAGTQLAARIVARTGVRTLLATSFALGAVGTLWLGFELNASANYPRLVLPLVLFGIGQGGAWNGIWIFAGLNVSRARQGIASGLVSTSMWIGGAAGLTILVRISETQGSSSGHTNVMAVFGTAAGAMLFAAVVVVLWRRD